MLLTAQLINLGSSAELVNKIKGTPNRNIHYYTYGQMDKEEGIAREDAAQLN